MTRQEFMDAVENLKIRSDSFSIDDGTRDECYVVIRSNSGWVFYYSERGNQNSVSHFISEEDALDFLLNCLLKDQSTRQIK